MHGEKVKLVGMLSPCQGWQLRDGSPAMILIVPGDGEYLVENTPVAAQLSELVYEQVLILGTVEAVDKRQHLTVESFQRFDGLGQDEWYDDDQMGSGY